MQAFEELVTKILETPGMDEQQSEEGTKVNVKAGATMLPSACGC